MADRRAIKQTQAREVQGLLGVVDKVIYSNPDNLFSVVSTATDQGPVVAVGFLGLVNRGEQLLLSGRFSEHPTYGRRLEVSHFQIVLPESETGIRAYLGSGLIPGLGPALAERIVARFKAEALEVIRSDPDRLLEVNGIGRKKLEQIKKAVSQREQMEGLAVFLQSHGLPASLAVRLFSVYKGQALAKVRADPYLLIREVRGLGFKKADDLALKLGHARDSEIRLAAGLVQILNEAADEGHVYLPYLELAARAARLLEVDQDKVKARLAQMAAQGRLILEDMNQDFNRFKADFKAVYLPGLHRAERSLALGLKALLETKSLIEPGQIKDALAQVEEGLSLRLARAQREALSRSLSSRVLVVTGGPGTGKTTLVRALVQLFFSLNTW